ncbi:hypothetical protein [Herbaspirillum robiniae]|uniref:Uncharacterized protein n=1 Tax=Herbaspirillum robiniae TaxID=2014887 RepID=A0A246WLL0_9BURK|nr:hypothetical protein [Herbaspirillum robiniae]NUU02731.1 hypothetical protein [Herbaspirillum robiniae]OWY27153.1 hypothetical protein CEJ42_21265 [Herbaspirillum robiniae]
MISAKNLMLALGVAGAAVAAALNVLARDARRRDRYLQRVALQRWEDEGGNLYPIKGVPPARRSGER